MSKELKSCPKCGTAVAAFTTEKGEGKMRYFTDAEFMDGRNSRTDAEREARCKTFCRFRKKHKCSKHGCRIVNAPDCGDSALEIPAKIEADERKVG